jgi:toxin ParE1/3/4
VDAGAIGINARDRYSKLIETTLLAISEDPLLRGSSEFQEVRLYHLRHSKKAAAVNGIIVKNPRHFVAYRDRIDTIKVLRLLHDQMDIEYYLGDDDRWLTRSR